MRYLFLMDEAECQNEPTLERLRILRKDNEIVVLSLGTLANLALRRNGIAYVTPDIFFSKEKSSAIDKQVVRFCREWYKSVDLPIMSFHGVLIGEILEYDFYCLFIDALRSVEIAKTILKDSFDAIYLPSSGSSIGFREIGFHTMCYETLPPILASLANQKSIGVARLEPSSNLRAKMRQKHGLHELVDFMTSSVRFLRRNCRDLVSILAHRDLKRVALVGHLFEGMTNSLGNTDARGLKTNPSYVHTPESWLHARAIVKLLRSEETIARIDHEIVYDGIPLWRALFPLVDTVVSTLIPKVLGRIQWTELFVTTLSPSSFVMSEDITALPRAMCQVLKMHGIPIVVVQHGILNGDMAGTYVLPVVGDCQAVWGEYYRNWHIERGKPSESQVVTGFPKHDELLRLPPLDRDGLCERFGLDPKVKTALVITEWFQATTSSDMVECEERYIRLALRSLKVYDGIQIVVKLHPDLQSRYHRIVSEIADQEGVRVLIARDSLWDLIRLSSFVIVSTSSVCVEALILGKPVISVNLADQRDMSGLVQDGLAIGAYSEDEIKSSIRKCMEIDAHHPVQADRTRQLLLPFIYLADGCASQRLAELIRTKSVRNPMSRQS
jgi:hypothetical protein